MGCDIHSVIEFREQDWWTGLGELEIGRWYSFFSNLAGERNYDGVEPVAQDRGFPSDASFVSKDVYSDWGPDAHNPSFASLEEFKKAYKMAGEDGRYTQPEIEAGISAMEKLEQLGHKTRLVFFFDN